MIIRPPRDLYPPEALGAAVFEVGQGVYTRKQVQLKGERGLLECTHFQPAKPALPKYPCVVYLHGSSSSRVEALSVLPALLRRGITVFSLDLSGSGHSGGEYISLGYHEEKDVEVAIRYLRESGTTSSIGIWGRSMGAVAGIFRAADDGEIAACVLDSPFSDLETIATEFGQGYFMVPQIVTAIGFEYICNEVQTRADFDPHDVSPIQYAPEAKCPALFCHASRDKIVHPHHVQELHDAWGGDKQLECFDGAHNGERPTWLLDCAADFLAKRLCAKVPSAKLQGVEIHRVLVPTVPNRNVAAQIRPSQLVGYGVKRVPPSQVLNLLPVQVA
jgi:pimeloyl-ACP methyl ester carboxylesterase